MGKKQSAFIFILVVLMALSVVYVIGGIQVYKRYQQESVAMQENCGGLSPVHICVRAPTAIFSAFYPSYLDSHYTLFAVDYNSSSSLTLVIKGAIAGFSQQQAQTVNATGSTATFSFTPPLLSQVLQSWTSEKDVLLHIQVTDLQNHMYYEGDTELLLHSRRLMLWMAADRLKIGAWVTPDDPAIVALVSSASTHLQDQMPPTPAGMVGYNGGAQQEVIDQVDAIYDTLRLNYHIRYVQARVPYSPTSDGSDATEEVKLPSEVLQERSGMCIELTVLLASAVEKIGLHAEIVIIPGHAFLGVAVSQDGKNMEYWDAVDVNDNVAADSANVQADALYATNTRQHTIVDTILLSDALNAHIGPMVE